MTLGLCTPVLFVPSPWSVFDPSVAFVHLFKMSLVVKTLACGGLTDCNGDTAKSVRVRHNLTGLGAPKKLKVGFAHVCILFFDERATLDNDGEC